MYLNYKNLTFEDLYNHIFGKTEQINQTKNELFKQAKERFGISKEELKKIDKLIKNNKIFSQKEFDINKLIRKKLDKQIIEFFIIKGLKASIPLLYQYNYFLETIRLALKNGSDINEITYYHTDKLQMDFICNALHISILNEDEYYSKFFIDHSIDINFNEINNHFTPLMIAVWIQNVEIVKLLLNNKNININTTDSYGVTPLIRASGLGNLEIVKLLVEKGALINSKDKKGGTAIEDAYFLNHFHIVDYLLSKGATLEDLKEFRHSNLDKNFKDIVENIFEDVIKTIKSDFIAKQFILEELESAYIANTNESKDWIKSSGFVINDFKNSMGKSLPEVDGAEGPQQTLNRNQLKFFAMDTEMGSEARRRVVDKVMKKFTLGKYSGTEEKIVLEDLTYMMINSLNEIEYNENIYKHLYDNKYFNSELQRYINIESHVVNFYGVNYEDNLDDKKDLKIIYKRDMTSNDILQEAIQKVDLELLTKAYSKNADFSHLNIMSFVVKDYSKEFIELLISFGVKLDTQNQYGYTALMAAVEKNKIDIVELLLQNKANYEIQANDYLNENNEETHNSLGDTALIIALNNNDRELNDNLNMIKTLLRYIKTISSYEALFLDSLLFNPEIAKSAANILVKEDDGSKQTLLMHTIYVQGYFLLYSFDSIWEISKDKSDSLENDKQEYINKILFVADNLIKGGVNLNYEYNNKTALKLATEFDLQEVVNLIQRYLEGKKRSKNGFIYFDKYMINIIENKILMNIIINDKPEVIELKKISDNTFQDNKNQEYFISREKVILKDQKGNNREYSVNSYSGNIFDIDSSHDPEALSKVLHNFSNNEKLRYTNHPWPDSLTYEKFYNDLTNGWKEIENDIKSLSPTLHHYISMFLFGNLENEIIGFSIDFIKEKLHKGEKPDSIKVLSKSIDSFKQSILIKNDEGQKLIDLFERVLEECNLDLNIDLEEIEDFKDRFYTDVKRLENALIIILKDIHKINPNANIKISINSDNNIVDLKIIHENSSYHGLSEQLKNTIGQTGNFTTIFDCLKSVCDWEVETTCKDGAKVIHYLYKQKDGKPYSEPSKEQNNISNFTHTLRFYK